MKLRIESKNFLRLLNSGLLKGNLETTRLDFLNDGDGVVVSDLSLLTLGVYSWYSRDYFIDFEGEPESVILTKDLLYVFKYLFRRKTRFRDRWIDFETNEPHLIVTGTKEYYRAVKQPLEFPFHIPMSQTNEGFIPEGSEWPVVVKLHSKDLIRVGGTDRYTITSKPASRLIVMEATNDRYQIDEACWRYEKKINVIRHKNFEECSIVVPQKHFKTIRSCVQGDIWLRFNSQALIVSEVFESENQGAYSLNFILSAIDDEDYF